MAVLNGLIEKSTLFDYANKYYILFSKSGFTGEVTNFVTYSNNIILVENFD